MATTPEGKVKIKVRRILDKYDGSIYYRMPVPSGFGKQGLDFEGAICGRAFAIETKALGNKPTPRQEQTIKEMLRGGVSVFVVDGGATRWEGDTFFTSIDIVDGWLSDQVEMKRRRLLTRS